MSRFSPATRYVGPNLTRQIYGVGRNLGPIYPHTPVVVDPNERLIIAPARVLVPGNFYDTYVSLYPGQHLMVRRLDGSVPVAGPDRFYLRWNQRLIIHGMPSTPMPSSSSTVVLAYPHDSVYIVHAAQRAGS